MLHLKTIFPLFLLLGESVVAQERPQIEFATQVYNTSVIYRQNVCDRHDEYYTGRVELRDALVGLQLRPLVILTPLFPLEDGAINPNNPGIIALLMDELGRRAGFSWRESFAVADIPRGDQTFTDLYFWGTETYDFVADWCLNSFERLQLGIGFPKGFYDGSYILIGKRDDALLLRGSLFSWVKPFKPSVWAAIIATLLVSTVVFVMLEYLNPYKKESKLFMGRSLYHSFMLFADQYEFEPIANAARVFAFSFVFWQLITNTAYTANLFSFFVVSYIPSDINSIDDAVRANLPICVWKNAGHAYYARQNYPEGIYVEKEELRDIYEGVNDGECHFALTTIQDWEMRQGDSEINGDCDLVWVGNVIKFVEAGMAVKSDAGVLCTGLIQDVFNLHFMEMIADGYVNQAWNDFIRKNRDVDCNVEITLQGNGHDSVKLSLREMAGTFFLHFAAIIVCFAITLCRKIRPSLADPQVLKESKNEEGENNKSENDNKSANGKDQNRNKNVATLRVMKLELLALQQQQTVMNKLFLDYQREEEKQLSMILSMIEPENKAKAFVE